MTFYKINFKYHALTLALCTLVAPTLSAKSHAANTVIENVTLQFHLDADCLATKSQIIFNRASDLNDIGDDESIQKFAKIVKKCAQPSLVRINGEDVLNTAQDADSGAQDAINESGNTDGGDKVSANITGISTETDSITGLSTETGSATGMSTEAGDVDISGMDAGDVNVELNILSIGSGSGDRTNTNTNWWWPW